MQFKFSHCLARLTQRFETVFLEIPEVVLAAENHKSAWVLKQKKKIENGIWKLGALFMKLIIEEKKSACFYTFTLGHMGSV